MNPLTSTAGAVRQTMAMAGICVRSAVRSRFVICLLVLLLLTIVGLPISIQGDGTLAGKAQVLLRYTLGLAGAIIGAAVLWIACGAISQEIESRRIHLTAVTPVYRFQIWLGKWLGLCAVCAVLLAVSGATVYMLLRYAVATSNAPAADRAALQREVLTGRRSVAPRSESVHDEAHAYVDRLVRNGSVPADQPLESVFLEVREQLLAQKYSVLPGACRTWVFDLPAELKTGHGEQPEIVGRFNFRSTSLTREPLMGTWTISADDGPPLFSCTVEDQPEGRHTFAVPAAALQPGATVSVTFANAPAGKSCTAVFDSEAGIEFLVTETSFERNLLTALLVVFCHLALLAAIGLTAGSMLSFPVATFAAASMLLICQATHYFATGPVSSHTECRHHHHGAPLEHGIVDAVGEKTLRTLSVIVEPAMELDSLGLMADGILVSGRLAGKAIVLLLIVYPGFCGLVAGFCLGRRELALPA